MKTTIVIPTFKRPQMVERLLINLGGCRFPPSVDICVVENGPPSGVKDICTTHSIGGLVRYLHLPSAGKSVALNAGIEASDAEFFIFFDDDVTVSANIVVTYVDAAQRYGPGHLFGGPLVADAEVKCPSNLVPYLPFSAKGWAIGDREREVPFDEFSFFFGANWAVFRSDLVATGLYSEEFSVTSSKLSPVGEELELQKRLIKNSVKAIYLPDALIHHYVSRECYTAAWVRRREFRRGIMDWKLSSSHEKRSSKTLGGARWVVRAVAEQSIGAAKSLLLNRPIEERTAISMRHAYLLGLLYGAWIGRNKLGDAPSQGESR